ncbi:MAG TPA: Maf family protein [Steroidobacteraceae bacterium]
MAPVILASTSPYRRMLLERLGVPFSTESPGVDEAEISGEAPPERARRLAAAKAHAVALRHPEAVVIGSDQVAAAGELILEKPATLARARGQLAALSGAEARFYTACAILAPAGSGAAHLDETRVVFRKLSAEEIERYVARERPLDCAGGFKAESLGVALFERIESSDPTALIGLPLIFVAAALRRFGHAVP